MRSSTIHEAEDGKIHKGEYAACRTCHGVKRCVAMPGCTGEYSPAWEGPGLTGWRFWLTEGDVPAHDCRTENPVQASQ